MVSPITNDERRQLRVGLAGAATVLVAVRTVLFLTGFDRWQDLLLPLSMFALTTEFLFRERRPEVSRWMLRVAILLTVGGCVYAFIYVWRIAHRLHG